MSWVVLGPPGLLSSRAIVLVSSRPWRHSGSLAETDTLLLLRLCGLGSPLAEGLTSPSPCRGSAALAPSVWRPARVQRSPASSESCRLHGGAHCRHLLRLAVPLVPLDSDALARIPCLQDQARASQKFRPCELAIQRAQVSSWSPGDVPPGIGPSVLDMQARTSAAAGRT